MNDLHYQVNSRSDVDSPKLSGKIIVINTGSLSKDSFRFELANTLSEIKKYNPKAIAIDHDFIVDTTLIGTKKLISTVDSFNNLILAKKDETYGGSLGFSNNVRYGNVTIPDNQSTVRRYSSDSSTFAYQIALQLTGNKIEKISNTTFFINYLTSQRGFFTKDSNQFYFYSARPEEKQYDFLMLEAKDIINGDSVVLETLKRLSPGRALLLGHLGSTSMYNTINDIEDKKAVPLNNIISHEKTMDGLIIHANAVENLISPENRFWAWSDSILFKILKNAFVFLFIFYLLNINLGKAVNIISLSILSIPIIYLVLYLMTKNIYLEVGLTLLQFLIVEEFVEAIESIEHLYSKFKQR